MVPEVLSVIRRCPLLGGLPYKVTLPQMCLTIMTICNELNQYTCRHGLWQQINNHKLTKSTLWVNMHAHNDKNRHAYNAILIYTGQLSYSHSNLLAIYRSSNKLMRSMTPTQCHPVSSAHWLQLQTCLLSFRLSLSSQQDWAPNYSWMIMIFSKDSARL